MKRLLLVRILLIAIAFVFPIATVTYLQVRELNRAATRASVEREGVVCLTRAYAVMHAVDTVDKSATPAVAAAFADYDSSQCPEHAQFARLARKNLGDATARQAVAIDLDLAINAISDETNLTFDPNPVTLDAADASAYALADALPRLTFAAATTSWLAAAKSEATAASRLTLLNEDIDQLIKLAGWTAVPLREPQQRAKADVAAYFAVLDRWEGQASLPRPDVKLPLRTALASLDRLFAAFTLVLDTSLQQQRGELDRRRTIIFITAVALLAVALAIVWFVGKSILQRHRVDVAHFAEVALKEARFQAIFAGRRCRLRSPI